MREERLLAYLKAVCPGRACRAGGTERKAVHRLRRRGEPIASDRNGYFYAQIAGEVYATIRQLKQMAIGLEAAIRGLEHALDRFTRGGGPP